MTIAQLRRLADEQMHRGKGLPVIYKMAMFGLEHPDGTRHLVDDWRVFFPSSINPATWSERMECR